MSNLSTGQGAERMREAIHEQEIADLQKRIAELGRHNELLRAVVKQTEPLFNMSAGFSGGRQEVHDAVVELNKKYQAAIDGGALDGEK